MKQGFTLIELLVVVLIIGILSSVALPQYTKAVEKSRATEAIQLLGNLATAEQVYHLGNGAYTTDLSLLDMQFPGYDGNAAFVTKNFVIKAGLSNTTFVATARRADSKGEIRTTEPYALNMTIDTDGKIVMWCGDDQDTDYGKGDNNKYCKAIANNSTGIMRAK